ncbi:gustatory receptor for bitter taste 22e-like [Zeugodacus cucurbitae]|uniref:gustatory receptor for bitter taste 22e-like n=1 Tax=Zeugodacus cucurbitae TaxID=28588 RepID=UPI0023D90DB0|nr:gustatory receptor for bitter taste 22e-like [Zeugodacus cucurbitae]
MCARYRIHFTDFILKATVSAANFLGILPFRYNKIKRRVESSKFLINYTIGINVITVILLILSWPTQDHLNVDILQRKPIVALVNSVNLYSTMYTIVLIIWANWRDHRRLLDFFNACWFMECECFRIFNEYQQECVQFDKYIIWKGVLTVLQNISFVNTVYDFENYSLFFRVLLIIFVYFLLNVMLITIQLFNICVLYQYRGFWVLNRRLEHISELELRQWNVVHIEEEISRLSGIYLRLLRICRRSTIMYEQQTLLMIAVLSGANILGLFFAKIIWTGKVLEMSAWSIFFNLQMILINLIDFWLTITICELTVNTSKRTSDLLRKFNDYRHLGKGLARNMEQFAFICCDNQLSFRVCGLFDLNHVTGCHVLFTMILYFIYFVQFDYNDL